MATVTYRQAQSRVIPAGLIGALILGGLAAVSGLGGFLAVVVGDEFVGLDLASGIAAAFTVVALVSAVIALERPSHGAIGLAAAPTAFIFAFGPAWSTWWARYQEAVATSGAAENAFWAAAPAMALFAIAGVLFAAAAALAAYHAATTVER